MDGVESMTSGATLRSVRCIACRFMCEGHEELNDCAVVDDAKVAEDVDKCIRRCDTVLGMALDAIECSPDILGLGIASQQMLGSRGCAICVPCSSMC